MTFATRTPPNTSKVVIYVHGIGRTRRGVSARMLADAVINWIQRHRLDSAAHKAEYSVDEELEGTELKAVTVAFPPQRWKFMEAYWADAFEPPLFDPIIGWTVNRVVSQSFAQILRLVRALYSLTIPFLLPLIFFLLWLPSMALAIIILALVIWGVSISLVIPRTVFRAIAPLSVRTWFGPILRILDRMRWSESPFIRDIVKIMLVLINRLLPSPATQAYRPLDEPGLPP